MTENVSTNIASACVKAAVAEGYRKVAPGWHKWRQEFKAAGAVVTEAILSASHVKPGMRVLDVGCGPGELALRVLPLVGDNGCVAAIDLVPEMLPRATAAESLIVFGVADAESLPFRDATFDLVMCRGAVMHFPDATQALCEAYRVLRPGGRAVFSALGPAEETTAIMATIAVVLRHATSPPPLAPGPDIYRFGLPGSLSALFCLANFQEVSERMFTAPCVWPGKAQHFWQALPDHAWRFAELIECLPTESRERVKMEVVAALRPYERDGLLHLSAPTVIVSGKR
ncbi:MAG: methyltransferase domain-containing protein [Pyrinomonadaceae bacterium]